MLIKNNVIYFYFDSSFSYWIWIYRRYCTKQLIKENFVKEEFNLDDENYELILISQKPLEYGVRFYNFGLSLKEIENLLSEKQSMNFKIEKSNESIRHLLNKLEVLNLEIQTKYQLV